MPDTTTTTSAPDNPNSDDSVNDVYEFSNQQVDMNSISESDLVFSPLSPKYRRLNMAVSAFWAILLNGGYFIATSDWFYPISEELEPFIPFGQGIILFFCLWNLIHHYLADPLKKYALREHDLHYQSGLIFKSMVSQPILRIQHIEIKRGPLERKAGLATIQVFSAGGATYTFFIPGLEHEKAIQLRQYILDHKDLAADV